MYPYYILIILAVFLFLHGFFPITKPSNSVNHEAPTHINNVSLHPQIYTSDVKKTVIIIIDALRLDFVNTNYMPLTSRITEENGCFNTITVETPTVTLPRIKALTAGNVPQFLDLVLNLASTEILQDSLIHSLLKKRKNIIFYGDDTWLKLFPNAFARYEGTSSFFVRDFKEVDDNVTRNVNIELERHDWDMMILHYLGLDHIGHVYGPFSSHIPGKLKEMDEIIYNIYSNISKKHEKVLLIVTGDHGMRDSGGHGGSSYSETHVPLLAIGHQCTNGSFFQIDIPVNLAVLLGLNIPSSSIGQIRSNLLQVSLEKYLYILRYNNLLLLNKANLCEDHFLLATKFHEMYIKSFDETYGLKAIDFYKNCSDSVSKYLINSSVKQNFSSLIISVLIMFNVLTILIKWAFTKTYDLTIFHTVEYVAYLIMIFLHFISLQHTFSIIVSIVLILLLIKNLVSFTKIIDIDTFQSTENIFIFFILTSIVHPLTFFSSSFVEEEHQYWYFFTNVLFVYTLTSKIRQRKNLFIYLVGLLSILRFLRTINSTGDKWANYPDLSDWLLKSQNEYYYQLFFIFGLVATFFTSLFLMNNITKVKMKLINVIILLCVFVLKSADYENVVLGKCIWFLIVFHAIVFHNCAMSWILILTLLLKPFNVILISFCILASMAFFKVYKSTTEITFCHFWLGNMLYFAQGHSNSLASVDVSVGYVGLSEYQPIFVIFQVLCHTYAFPVLSHLLILRNKSIDSSRVWTILFCNRLYITAITCIITVTFRHHLFIWSVFAPKLFIESVHLIFLFIEFSIYFYLKQLKSFLKRLKI